jgi:quinol monooxygenase YgiN
MPESAKACTVTYLETLGITARDARPILKDYAGMRAEMRGVASVDFLERAGIAGQFVLIETGTLGALSMDEAAGARNAALAPLLLAPCDVRSHAALSVAPNVTVPATASDALWIVTHIDAVPVHKDSAAARVVSHSERSRRAPGCLRFEAWQQAGRANHMTLIEVWSGAAAHDDHRVADDTRGYRDHLAPACGALYDERVYRRIVA